MLSRAAPSAVGSGAGGVKDDALSQSSVAATPVPVVAAPAAAAPPPAATEAPSLWRVLCTSPFPLVMALRSGVGLTMFAVFDLFPLWAIATRRFPFDQLERTSEIFRAVRAGVRPPLPEDAAAFEPFASWFGLVQSCWAHQAEDRPSIEHVVGALELIPLSAVQLLDDQEIDDPFEIALTPD